MVAPSYLRSMQAVELAARTGSLKAAADLLAITPAAVGQRVKALEDFLGIELFVRGRSGLIPTPSLAGALPHLKQAFRELETAGALLDLQRGHELHIAAEADFADLWLKPRIGAFKGEHPNIALSINGEGEAGFRPAPADCEISFGPPGDGRDLLFRDFVLPVSSAENTRRLAHLPEQDRIEGFPLLQLDFYRNDPAAPDWRDWIERQGINRTAPDRGIRFRRIVPALEAVLANAGLVVCGVALLSEPMDDGRLSLPFPVSTGSWTEHAFVARFRGEGRPHVRRFRDWLLAESQTTRDWLVRFAGP
ncbi:LysR family transcriptional regulator [Phenylobacterium sp.]|jgi:LysR family glycine cleavage system transcriptional activator|uniref:LysR family transcriptional regulator n=1 Tax=Phenylobacterium sp. TaxID=1871053 RepID=UPI002F93B627